MYNHMFNKNHLNLKNNYIKSLASYKNLIPKQQSKDYKHSKIEREICITYVIYKHISTCRKIIMVCGIMGGFSFSFFQFQIMNMYSIIRRECDCNSFENRKLRICF